MISRLIDISVPVDMEPTKYTTYDNYSIFDYASAFVYGMETTQRERFRQMLELGIKAGMSVAESYGVDYDEFILRVKQLLKLED